MARRRNYILEEEILFTNKKIFGDEFEHAYDCKCFDGYAIGTVADSEETNIPKTIRILYPLRSDILSNENKAEYVLQYRGLHDLSPKDITYGDIMVCYGTIIPIKTRKIINSTWCDFDKQVANCHLNNYGVIYLDEYSCPMDIEEVEMLLHPTE